MATNGVDLEHSSDSFCERLVGNGQTRFSAAVRRIEVHAGPLETSADEMAWILHGQPHESNKLLLYGYLRRSGPEGFGQAQVVGMVSDCPQDSLFEPLADGSTVAQAIELDFAETLYDNARRALQAQASLMDFQFRLETKAPPVDLVLTFDADGSEEI